MARRHGATFGSGILVNEHTRSSTYSDGQAIYVVLPERMDFEDNYETTVSHLHNVRLAAKGQIKLKLLDFSNLKYISTSAALVLASEVDRWNHRIKKRIRAKVETWHEDIKRLLCQMGYFELLGLKKPDYPPFSKPTVFLPFKRGLVVQGDGGLLIQQLRIEIEETVGSRIKKLELFGGLSEAITNVSQHAYPKDAAFRQWWLSASYDQSTQRLCVTFYDQGLTIPVTLPLSKVAKFIANLLNLNRDSEKIEAAMEVGRSSTGDPERGQGLGDLLQFALAYDGGMLTIYSRRGMYRVNARKNEDEPILRSEKKDFERSIGGTLIEWSVKIPAST